jgi:hypothetical protein
MHLGCTVGELGERMTSAEFAEWVAFAALEPFGSRVEDLRVGTLASAVTAPWGGKASAGDWFNWSGAEKVTGDWRHIFGAMGAFVKKPVEGAGK